MDVFDLFAKISLDTSEYENGLGKASKDANSFGERLNGIGSGIGSMAKAAVEGFQAVESVGKTAGDVVTTGIKGFAAASTAVAGFAATSVKSGMDFDAAMSEVSAISGATGEDLDVLRDKALEMGAKTKFSASEAGEAMTYMAMAGWKAEDMLGGIEGIMNLAAASGEDLATTSDIVTDALTAFGQSAEDSGRLADIMAAASSNANTNVSMLGESFKYVAPVAGALGYSMEDTSVALGLMANSGIKASQGGTALRTALTNLANPTSNMAKVMDQYGISLTDADGEMYSLGEMMVQLREKFGGLDEATQAAAAGTLFGKEAMSGMLAIINASEEDYDKLTTAIYDCNGASEEMSATMIDNLQGDLTLLGSAFESLQIAVSDSLTPTLRDFTKFGATSMQNLLEGFQGDGVSGFMDALSGIVTDGITLLAEKAPEFASVSIQFIETLAKGILGAKDQIFESAGTIIDSLVDGIYFMMENHGKDIIEFGYQIIETISKGFLDAGNAISYYIGEFIPLIANAFLSYHESLLSVGIEILGAIGQGIVDSKDELQSMASETVLNMVDALIENAPAIIDGAIVLLDVIVSTISENTEKLADAAILIVEKLVDVLMENLPMLAKSAIQIIVTLAEKLSEALPELVPAIVEVILEIVDILTDPENLGVLLDAALQIIVALAEGISAALPELLAKVPEILVNLGTSFIEAIPILLESLVKVGVAIVDGIWQGIQSAAGQFKEDVKDFFGGIVDGVKDFLGIHSPSRVFADIGGNMAAGLGEGWDNEFDRIKSQIEGGLDFGTASIGVAANVNGIGMTRNSAYSGAGSAVNGNQPRDIIINLTAELDGEVIARKQVRHNERAQTLVGGSMVSMTSW